MSGTNYNAIFNGEVKISLTDENGAATQAECLGNPNAVATQPLVYANSCIMRRQGIGSGNNLYENTGTYALPVWTQLGGGGGSVGATEIAYGDAFGNIISDSQATRDPVTHYTNIAADLYVFGFPVFTGVGIDDIRIDGVFTGNPTDVYTITIVSTDHFDWSNSGGGGASNVLMTGGSQPLNNGLNIQFGGLIHTPGDFYTISILTITASKFIGTLAGQITGLGDLYLDGVNGIIGVSAFGQTGTPYSGIWGVTSFGPGRQALINAAITDTGGDFTINTSDLGGTYQAQLTVRADNLGSGIRFNYGGAEFYTFPSVQATVPGQVLTDPLGNGDLAWVAGGGGLPLAVGNPIGLGSANRILYENSGNTLQESPDLVYDDTNGQFTVSWSGGNRLNILPTVGVYGIGDLNAVDNGNYIQIDDIGNLITTGFSQLYQVLDTNTAYQYIKLFSGDVEIRNFGIGNLISIGDTGADGNSTLFQSDDFSMQMFMQTGGTFAVQSPAGVQVLLTEQSPLKAVLGDVNGLGNGMQLFVDNSIHQACLGDVLGVANGTIIRLQDDVQTIIMGGTVGQMVMNFNNGHTDISTLTTRILTVSGGRMFEANDNATSPIVSFGDLDNLNGGPTMVLDSSTQIVTVFTDNLFFVKNATSGDRAVTVDAGTYSVAIGDASQLHNGTRLVVDDSVKGTTVYGAFATASMQVFTGTGNITIADGKCGLYYDPAATQATATITLPALAHDGDIVEILFGGTLTAGTIVTLLTIAPNAGQTILGTLPTTATIDSHIGYKFRAATNQWYRVD